MNGWERRERRKSLKDERNERGEKKVERGERWERWEQGERTKREPSTLTTALNFFRNRSEESEAIPNPNGTRNSPSQLTLKHRRSSPIFPSTSDIVISDGDNRGGEREIPSPYGHAHYSNRHQLYEMGKRHLDASRQVLRDPRKWGHKFTLKKSFSSFEITRKFLVKIRQIIDAEGNFAWPLNLFCPLVLLEKSK